MFARFKKNLEPIERPYCYLLPLGVVFLGDRSCGTTLLLVVSFGEHKYADTFRESVFLRHVPPIPPQPRAKRAPQQSDHEPWALTSGLILLTYCTIEPISARIAAILHGLLHGCVAALFCIQIFSTFATVERQAMQ